ncbi:MAG: UDP-3-O-(3-hydroxymyristoyl)glucosamine N-acyltransferase [Pseudomonadales bacterium]
MNYTLGEIAERFSLELRGDPTIQISGIASLEEATVEQLAFLFNSTFTKSLAGSQAAAVVLSENDAASTDKPTLISAQPRLALARIASLFDSRPLPDQRVHETAVVAATASYGSQVTIGANTVVESNARIDTGSEIGPGCFIGANVRIGEGAQIAANVSIYHDVEIGERVVIHSGAVLGADGFGFEFDTQTSTLVKVPQIYSVQIGNDVEIGAGTTIDRGALRHTIIGNGVKLDNQVQIGHNSRVGNNTAISGCTAVAGSTTIGAYCLIGGGVGIINNIEIADQVEVTAMSLVSRSIKEKGRYSSGTGLMSGTLWKRNIVGFSKLDELFKRVRSLERLEKKK